MKYFSCKILCETNLNIAGSYGVRLVRFFIFNSSMQTREGEENKKIVFFRDNTTDDPSLHARYVGLIEAAVSFTKNFINEKKNSKGNTVSRTLHTLKTKSVTIEPEPGLATTSFFSVCFL